MRAFSGRHILALLLLAQLGVGSLRAQPTPPPPPPPDSGFSVRESTVGYIDNALIGNQLRLRYETAYDFTRPTRAEFFYARSSPGPGFPFAERSLDYQDVSLYGEAALGNCLSVFVEAPFRWLNPEVNDNTSGLSDMNAGFKLALWNDGDCLATFQFRSYFPTGDASRGLGNDHLTLEPGLLLFARLGDRCCAEAELKLWIPIDGTEDFAGEVVRYGVGVSYDLDPCSRCRVRPVVEVVGWTVLDGRVAVVPPVGAATIEDASGDTIVNLKLGVRFNLTDTIDAYVGYGRALTGDTWYEDVIRGEVRVFGW